MTAKEPRDLDFWSQTFWSTGNLPWHIKNTNEFLVRHLDSLTKEGETPTVLVPLCGKTADLVYLRDKGFKVIGVEGNRQPIEYFKMESGLRLKEGVLNGVIFHETEDHKLTIFQTDFLFMNIPSLEGTIDCVWDRAALNAISIHQRKDYITTVKKLLKATSFRYLLSAYEYDVDKGDGPPYSLPQEDVQQLLANFAGITKLEEKGIEINDGPMTKFVDEEVTVNEVIYVVIHSENE